MKLWKKVCVGMALLLALGVAAGTQGPQSAHQGGAAPAIHTNQVGSDFPPPTGG